MTKMAGLSPPEEGRSAAREENPKDHSTRRPLKTERKQFARPAAWVRTGAPLREAGTTGIGHLRKLIRNWRLQIIS